MTNPTSVRELAERLWTGDTSSGEVHPVHTAYPEGEEIADGVLYFKGVASVNTIDTGDALVMLDTGTSRSRSGCSSWCAPGGRTPSPTRPSCWSPSRGRWSRS
ncbi:MAG: hypothetical protein WD557_03260 [Dehalococcoidia bacterium]